MKLLIKYIAIGLIIIGLIFLSEVLFLASHRRLHYAFVGYCLLGAQSNFYDQQKSFECLETSAEWVFKMLPEDQKKLLPITQWSQLTITLPDELQNRLWLHFQNTNISVLSTERVNLADTYYFMAIEAAKINRMDLVELFLQRSVYLSPQLSFYWVELANYFLMQGDAQRSALVLADCMKHYFPKSHCEVFSQEPHFLDKKLPIGFSQEDLRRYYQEKEVEHAGN